MVFWYDLNVLGIKMLTRKLFIIPRVLQCIVCKDGVDRANTRSYQTWPDMKKARPGRGMKKACPGASTKSRARPEPHFLGKNTTRHNTTRSGATKHAKLVKLGLDTMAWHKRPMFCNFWPNPIQSGLMCAELVQVNSLWARSETRPTTIFNICFELQMPIEKLCFHSECNSFFLSFSL